MTDAREAAALVALVHAGIPPDVQELLVRGNPDIGVAPHALAAAIDAYISTAVPADVEAVAQRLDEGAREIEQNDLDLDIDPRTDDALNALIDSATIIRAQAAQLAEAKQTSRDEIKGSYLNGRADAEAESARLRKEHQSLLIDCAGLIDNIKGEWQAGGVWSEWDQQVRDRISSALRAINGGKDG